RPVVPRGRVHARQRGSRSWLNPVYCNAYCFSGITRCMNLGQQILRTDAAGMPLEWIDYQDAARLYHLDQVAYAIGRVMFTLHGGINAFTGRRSRLAVHTIIATWSGDANGLAARRQHWIPP